MRLYFSIGDKGGCGKSTIASMITDYIYRQSMNSKNEVKLYCCDCDMREDGQSSFTRLISGMKSQGHVEVSQGYYELEIVDGFANLFSDISENRYDFTIVDTGANMTKFLNDNYLLLNKYTSVFPDIMMKNIFTICTTYDSTVAANEYINAFFNCELVSTTFVLNNDRNRRKPFFDFMNNEKMLSRINKFNAKNSTSSMEIVNYGYIPELVHNVSNFDKSEPRLPYSIINANDVNPAFKIAYEIWLAESDKAIAQML